MAAQGQSQRGFVQDVLLNAFEPGVNSSVLLFLNGVFVLLLCTLAVVAVFVGLNMHILFLGLLAVGLMVGFNWFVLQLHPTTGDQQSSQLDTGKTSHHTPPMDGHRTKQE